MGCCPIAEIVRNVVRFAVYAATTSSAKKEKTRTKALPARDVGAKPPAPVIVTPAM